MEDKGNRKSKNNSDKSLSPYHKVRKWSKKLASGSEDLSRAVKDVWNNGFDFDRFWRVKKIE